MMIRRVVRKIRIEEWLAMGVFTTALAVDIFFFGKRMSAWEGIAYVIRYFTYGDTWYWLFFYTIYLLVAWKFYVYVRHLAIDRLVEKQKMTPSGNRDAITSLMSPLRAVFPFALPAAPLSALLLDMSSALQFSTKDLWFWFADQTLFGTQFFITLAHAFAGAPILTNVIFFSYIHLGLAFNVVLIFLFFKHRKYLFRYMVLTFVVSITIAFPFFATMPCQDPFNFFIRNTQEQSFPQHVTSALVFYQPSSQATHLMSGISKAETLSREGEHAAPITCFPSMHAVWSLLIVYFLARYDRRTLFFSVPWMFLVLTGGLYFGQHYGVDYLMGAAVASVSIWISKKLLAVDRRREQELVAVPIKND